MKIKSVKAKYELQAAPMLQISFTIDQDETLCESRCLSFDPASEDYGLIGRMRIYDQSENGLIQEWEVKLELKAKLSYGNLDELIENEIFKHLRIYKRRMEDPDKIGCYWTDDPAVVWLSRKETFEKVVRGWAIRDRRTFSGEILGENEKAENVKVVLSDNGMVQLYIDNKVIKEGYMEPRRCVSEKIDDKGEAVKQFERIEFAEFLDEIETHI